MWARSAAVLAVGAHRRISIWSGWRQGLSGNPQFDSRLASSMSTLVGSETFSAIFFASSEDFAMLDACSKAEVTLTGDSAGAGARWGSEGLLCFPNVEEE